MITHLLILMMWCVFGVLGLIGFVSFLILLLQKANFGIIGLVFFAFIVCCLIPPLFIVAFGILVIMGLVGVMHKMAGP